MRRSRLLFVLPLLFLASCSLQKNPDPSDLNLGTSWGNANVDYGQLLLNSNFNSWDASANANGNPNGQGNANVNAAFTPLPPSSASPSPSPSANANGAIGGGEAVRTIALLPPELPSDPALMVPHEVAFDCGLPTTFAKRRFYDRFILQLEATERYSPAEVSAIIAADPAAAKRIQIQTETRDNLDVVCYAKDESLVLGLVGNGTDGYGAKLVRYLPYRDLLEVAVRSDVLHSASWPVFPTSFGARRGRVITLKGSNAKASGEFSYDFIANFLEFTECRNGRSDPCHLMVRPLPTPLVKK